MLNLANKCPHGVYLGTNMRCMVCEPTAAIYAANKARAAHFFCVPDGTLMEPEGIALKLALLQAELDEGTTPSETEQ